MREEGGRSTAPGGHTTPHARRGSRGRQVPRLRLWRLDADQKADRGSVRMGQDRGGLAQGAPSRPAQGRLAVHPRHDGLQSRPITEIAGEACVMRARAALRGALKALRPISQAPQNTCRTAVGTMKLPLRAIKPKIPAAFQHPAKTSVISLPLALRPV